MNRVNTTMNPCFLALVDVALWAILSINEAEAHTCIKDKLFTKY